MGDLPQPTCPSTSGDPEATVRTTLHTNGCGEQLESHVKSSDSQAPSLKDRHNGVLQADTADQMKMVAVLPLFYKDVMQGKSLLGHVLLPLGLSFPWLMHMMVKCTLKRRCFLVLRDCFRS